jgi:outer membrane murein-binding lipoprotein Lpp
VPVILAAADDVEFRARHEIKEIRVDMKRKSRAQMGACGLIAMSAAVVLNGAPVQAQEQAQQSDVAALRAQIEELTSRLEKIEADQKKSTETAAKASPTVSSKFPLTVSGLLQIHSLNYFNQDGTGTKPADTFRLRRGEIRITAPSITPRVSGTVLIDPAKSSFRIRVPAVPGNVDTRARDSLLQEIQISYMLNKKGDRSNYIDVGQYKIPIGYESLQSTSSLQTVERALVFTQRDPFDGGYGDVRDTGVQLRGTTGKIDYRLGVFNGFGDRQNATAISDQKAVLGRLSYHPSSALEVGVSGGLGHTGTATGTPRDKRTLFNLFGVYKKDKWSFQSEYMTGDSQLQNGTQTRNVKGYYAGLGYLFTPKIEGILRYDYLDTDRDLSNASVRDSILGVNYYLKGHNAKIQTNIVRRNGSAGAPADLRNDRIELRSNFQIAF